MNFKFILMILLFVLFSMFLHTKNVLALGVCNSEYAGCERDAGAVDCSYCSGGFEGHYGYIDWGAAGYCCIDTWANGVKEMAGRYCYGEPECTKDCESYTDNKRWCHYNASYSNYKDCSPNVKGIAIRQSCPPAFYECAPGYMWREQGLIDCETHGYDCTCIPVCTLEDYRGFDQAANQNCINGCANFNVSDCRKKCDTNMNKCATNCDESGGGQDCINSCINSLQTCMTKCDNFDYTRCVNDCAITATGCHKCPAVGKDKSGNPLYGWGANSVSEIDDGIIATITSCRAVAGRIFYDTTGEFKYTKTCYYSE